VRAYERAADKYYDRPKVGADAMYAAGIAWNRLARRAEYDQSIAGNAINFLNDFKALYPEDQRSEEATKIVSTLKTEQARGALKTAEFYEKYKRYQGALVYYNEVVVKDPNSTFAAQARERIEFLKPKAQRQVRRWSENDARQLERERINATNAPSGKSPKQSP
jgi:outer membrane protein assembly factor BamD (BamD/ComL family)